MIVGNNNVFIQFTAVWYSSDLTVSRSSSCDHATYYAIEDTSNLLPTQWFQLAKQLAISKITALINILLQQMAR